jgi:hypothetical protein
MMFSNWEAGDMPFIAGGDGKNPKIIYNPDLS